VPLGSAVWRGVSLAGGIFGRRAAGVSLAGAASLVAEPVTEIIPPDHAARIGSAASLVAGPATKRRWGRRAAGRSAVVFLGNAVKCREYHER